MATVKKKRKRRSRRSLKVTLILMILAVAAYLVLCGLDMAGIVDMGDANIFNQHEIDDDDDYDRGSDEDEAIFHFIDVGQGDAILITAPRGNVLIDTSESGAEEELFDYLKKVKVKKIDYLVLTHTDADHIGNADKIIQNFDIGKVVMTDHIATTKTFERLLDAIEEKDLEVINPKVGEKISLGALKLTVIGPTEKYDDPNEMSIVLKATFGDTSVMLTGDAEKESEGDIVSYWKKESLKCDILKVGHHGSSSSTTEKFFEAVDPDIAVISCGEGNKYGHPHKETMERLEAAGVNIYRTDLHGSIVFRTDGESFKLVSTEK